MLKMPMPKVNGHHSSLGMVWRPSRKWSVAFLICTVYVLTFNNMNSQFDRYLSKNPKPAMPSDDSPLASEFLIWPMGAKSWLIVVFAFIASSGCVGSYGHSWMCNPIKSHVTSDAVGCSSCQELQDYPTSPLKDVNDVVAWWGVSITTY